MINERILKMSVNEAELTLASVKAETAVELSRIREARKLAQQEHDRFMAEAQPEKLRLSQLIAEYDAKTLENASEREQMAKEKLWHLKAVKELQEQNRLALKDLAWVNDKVLKAEELIKEKKQEILDLDTEISKRVVERDTFVSLEKIIVELDKHRIEILTESDLSKANALAYLQRVEHEVTDLLEQRDKAVDETRKAQYDLKAYTDQLFVKREDFKVYVYRLEEHYKKAFPDLVIKI